jgi:hypothetical protein
VDDHLHLVEQPQVGERPGECRAGLLLKRNVAE